MSASMVRGDGLCDSAATTDVKVEKGCRCTDLLAAVPDDARVVERIGKLEAYSTSPDMRYYKH